MSSIDFSGKSLENCSDSFIQTNFNDDDCESYLPDEMNQVSMDDVFSVNDQLDDSEKNFFQNSSKIHPNLNITQSEAMMMVMMFYLKHNLTWVALTDLLSLINNIFGSNVLPQSKYLFKKSFPTNMKPQYNYFCQSCSMSVENLDIENCLNCRSKLNLDSSRGNNFFISLPVVAQVKQILRNNKKNLLPQSIIQNRPLGKISDVFDGNLYKNLVKISSGRNLITLTFNTDGVKVFKSTKKGSFWPLQFIINELDPVVRYKSENIVVCGFWFGSDPIVELFLKPFIEELASVQMQTLTITDDDFKFDFILFALLCTLDTVAKDKLQKKKQFNGYLGCSYCLHPGTRVIGHQIRYCNCENDISNRTHENALKDMKKASATQEIINGFKNISPVLGLPNFNVINGFCIDYMHSILLGVSRQMMELWLSSENHHEKY